MIICWVFQIQGLNHIYLQWWKVTKYMFSILSFSEILLLHFSSPIWFHATLYTSTLLHFSFFRSLLPSLLSVTSCLFVFLNRCLHGLTFYLVLWSVKLSKLQEVVTTPRPKDWAHWFLVFLSQQMHHRSPPLIVILTSRKRLQCRLVSYTCASDQRPGGSEMNLNGKPSALLSFIGKLFHVW